MTDAAVLFVDDEADLRIAGAQTLTLADVPVIACATAAEALDHISPAFPGILVTDIRMPGMDGKALMAEALRRDPDLPVILVTGHGDVELAVESIRKGAYDFIEKPYDPARLVEIIRRALDKRHLTMEVRALKAQASAKRADPIAAQLIGRSQVMAQLRAQLTAVAETETDVLIEGATGTGKEVAARALHGASARAAKPFVAVNCAALPDTLIESELFGHAPGAFAGAARERYGKFRHAQGGTLFLDQIDSIPLPLQGKLLTALQDRAITPLGSNEAVPLDLRVIAASKRDLAQAASEGTFRDDLLYRLNVVTLRMPPLAERREDIPGLFQILLAGASARHNRPVPAISPDALADLATRSWPGNIRELRNEAERAILGLGLDGDPPNKGRLADQMAAHERSLIAATLSAQGGSIKATYEALGISRKALYEKMQKHGLDRSDFRPPPGAQNP
ncbi:Fis family transcriptional regulator [Jannaschia sp. EhC01]|uniref:Nif-specific regulatory protein n=1 Tax=Gymnodinialimonas phycosphaerae TaxID=2841589 RepID=A0A975TX94_9RHOB|nr:sigma-54 dependent transcriptional regulator [Gymnodinialimonas phycosphaerae]MBY4892378.1 sigma-54 dependent transcriptional regulator [Gymnodinialimonas phycosphaerae]OAN84421.1 Fis family transcriptional regulator [Jannaschia sp. EhC01]